MSSTLGRALRRGLVAASMLVAGAVSGMDAAWAQSDDRPTLDVQRFDPVTQFPGFTVVRDPEVLHPLRFDAVLSANYAYQPFELSDADSGDRVAGIIDHLVGMDLGLGLAPLKWLHFGVEMPFLQAALVGEDDAEFGPALGGSGRTVGIGDLRFAVNFRPLRQHQNGPISLMLTPYLVAPTGSRGVWVGSGVPAVGIDGALGGHWKNFRFSVTTGFEFLANNNEAVAGIKADDEWKFGAAIGVPFLAQEELEVDLEWYGGAVVNAAALEEIGATTFGVGHVPMELLLGLTWRPPELPFWLKVGGGRGLTNGFGSPEARAFMQLGLAFEKKPIPDTDEDGYLDPDDACPEDPEDFDAFEDADGCPEPDNDQDGILDVDDACPLIAEDLDGFEDEDGCPDEDNDQDGILDVDDDCPMEAEDKDGWKDEDGCPDPDNDFDKILDADDACPNEAEVINGVDDRDGCPDEALATVDEEKKEIVILDRIYFDLGRSTIQKRSLPVVDAVAAILREYPDIGNVEIQGHTDSRGSERTNQRLSEGRAKAVRQALIERGIPADNLTAVGYGESRLLVPDASVEEEHQANRRVQFLIQADEDVDAEFENAEAPDAVSVPE